MVISMLKYPIIFFCIDKCKPGFFSSNGLAKCFPCPSGTYASGLMNTNCTSCPAGTTTILPAAGGREECGSKYEWLYYDLHTLKLNVIYVC